jgi:hypothetical protein
MGARIAIDASGEYLSRLTRKDGNAQRNQQ